jgi:argininosuccinate synthase
VAEGSKSENAIYRYDLATYSEGDAFDHSASVGFIKVWGLPIKTWTQTHEKGKVNFKSAVREKKLTALAENPAAVCEISA